MGRDSSEPHDGQGTMRSVARRADSGGRSESPRELARCFVDRTRPVAPTVVLPQAAHARRGWLQAGPEQRQVQPGPGEAARDVVAVRIAVLDRVDVVVRDECALDRVAVRVSLDATGQFAGQVLREAGARAGAAAAEVSPSASAPPCPRSRLAGHFTTPTSRCPSASPCRSAAPRCTISLNAPTRLSTKRRRKGGTGSPSPHSLWPCRRSAPQPTTAPSGGRPGDGNGRARRLEGDHAAARAAPAVGCGPERGGAIQAIGNARHTPLFGF